MALTHHRTTNTAGDCLSNQQDALSDSLWLAIPMRVVMVCPSLAGIYPLDPPFAIQFPEF